MNTQPPAPPKENALVLTEPEAELKLAVLNSNVAEMDRTDIVTRLTNMRLPQEVVTRIDELWDKTKVVGGHVIQIGKIILAEILKFAEKNPHLVLGVALGAAVGALVGMLVGIVPWIGATLAPLATALGIGIGAIAGYKLDKGEQAKNEYIAAAQEMIEIAKKFFEPFAAIFIALRNHFQE